MNTFDGNECRTDDCIKTAGPSGFCPSCQQRMGRRIDPLNPQPRGGARTALTDEQIQFIRAKHRLFWSVTRIAKELAVSKVVVLKYIRKDHDR